MMACKNIFEAVSATLLEMGRLSHYIHHVGGIVYACTLLRAGKFGTVTGRFCLLFSSELRVHNIDNADTLGYRVHRIAD